jgi:hypothetical protein
VIQSLSTNRGNGPFLDFVKTSGNGTGEGGEYSGTGDGPNDGNGRGCGDGILAGDALGDGRSHGAVADFLACPEPADLTSLVVNTLCRMGS